MFFLLFCSALDTVYAGSIQGAGTDLQWAIDYGLDVRGHCSFTFTAGLCGEFQLGLYRDYNTTVPRYDIILNRKTQTPGSVGLVTDILKVCNNCTSNYQLQGVTVNQTESFFPCTREMSEFWVSWMNKTVMVGRGNETRENIVAEWFDAEFPGVKYVKMGAYRESTSATYVFDDMEPNLSNPNSACNVAESNTSTTTPTATEDIIAPDTFNDDEVSNVQVPAAPTDATSTATSSSTTTIPQVKGDIRSESLNSNGDTKTSEKTGITINNCPKQHRPESEGLSIVFVRAADGYTLSQTNPQLLEITSATTGSCARKCASLQTCVLYSISDSGVCRITESCQPMVETEPSTSVLRISYWE